ncbi:hypothetical protein CVT24_005825 [Panaeolus cyanescens]|uniref:RRM domain-containing protein n=1 Tax=Panaeolus cyanescens TaxID=181874 RepID=A0A409V907_9AGAR|nr:hypothetical protein CVT24_005825 [Panaeolus cyanescens]
MDAPITKRLIISGLTPAISADDIQRRLSTFGTVKATDGFGLKDGVDQPRKFAYVTIETTTGKLSRCMNLLSGSTWKGAKLRFGEAKPDFQERIAKEIEENEQLKQQPPKKKRKYGAVLAEDMSLVTPENAKQRGWKVTEMGRIMKPVKIRPTHPLPDIQETRSKPVKGKADATEKKKKKRVKEADTRARRRTIDMTKWGSTHLKGMFLDLAVVDGGDKSVNIPYDHNGEEDEASERESSSEDEEDVVEVQEQLEKPSKSPPVALPARTNEAELETTKASSKPPKIAASQTPIQPPPKPPLPVPTASSKEQHLDNVTDIQLETAKSLNLLSSLFNDDDDDWIAQESVGSDINEEALTKGDRMLIDEDADTFEIVPKDTTSATHLKQHVDQDDDDNDMDVEEPRSQEASKTEAPSKKSGLKDLFAPTETETGFSLLGHLNLQLDLDEELAFAVEPNAPQPEETSSVPITVSQTITKSQASQAPLVLNPRQALFFPLPSDGNITKARQKDFFDLVKDNRWNWADPSVAFYRTGKEEDIRKRWEESKRDLTTDWKKRWKEAGKLNKRRRGGVDVDNV